MCVRECEKAVIVFLWPPSPVFSFLKEGDLSGELRRAKAHPDINLVILENTVLNIENLFKSKVLQKTLAEV